MPIPQSESIRVVPWPAVVLFIGRHEMWQLKPDGSVCRLTVIEREIKIAEFEWRAEGR